MTRSLHFAAWAVLVCLVSSGCGQKGPLFLPKDQVLPAQAKAKAKKAPQAKPKPQVSPSPQPSAAPEAPSPDEDDAQDGYAPMSDEPTF